MHDNFALLYIRFPNLSSKTYTLIIILVFGTIEKKKLALILYSCDTLCNRQYTYILYMQISSHIPSASGIETMLKPKFHIQTNSIYLYPTKTTPCADLLSPPSRHPRYTVRDNTSRMPGPIGHTAFRVTVLTGTSLTGFMHTQSLTISSLNARVTCV